MYINKSLELIRSQRVMELGCGVGLLGTIAASIQLDTVSAEPPSLWLTDVNEYVLQRCEVNLRLPCSTSLALSHAETLTLIIVTQIRRIHTQI